MSDTKPEQENLVATIERFSLIMARSWAKCDQFNANTPVGSQVTYTPISGPSEGILDRPFKTVTRSEAWALPDGTPVVMVQGKSGGVHLDHIQVNPS